MRKVRNQSKAAVTRARELRSSMGDAEKRLWALLRNKRLEFRFRRQYAVDCYFLDFYCPRAKLCVELDGDFHVGREERDAHRDAVLLSYGIATLRINTPELYRKPDDVTNWIWQACFDRVAELEG